MREKREDASAYKERLEVEITENFDNKHSTNYWLRLTTRVAWLLLFLQISVVMFLSMPFIMYTNCFITIVTFDNDDKNIFNFFLILRRSSIGGGERV